MNLDKIKALRSKDLFYLVTYSMLGLSTPFFILILILQAFGTPFTFNEVPYYGIEGLLYSLLFFPIFIIMGIIILWIYIAGGWKLARSIFPIIGIWKKNDLL